MSCPLYSLFELHVGILCGHITNPGMQDQSVYLCFIFVTLNRSNQVMVLMSASFLTIRFCCIPASCKTKNENGKLNGISKQGVEMSEK